MFLCWRPPYCPRERRRRQRPDRCKKLQEKLRKVQEQERRRVQTGLERRRMQEHERRKLHEGERRGPGEQERRRSGEQERRRQGDEERSSSREQERHMQWPKPSSMRSLTPSQSSEEGALQDNYGIAEMLNPDNLTTGMKIAASAVLLLLLYLVLRRGSSQFCVCLPDVWYGIKDFIDLIIGAIKATIIEIISFDGSCFSPYLQEILSLTWKYVF